MQRPRFVSLGSALALLVLLGNSAQGETDPLKGLDDYINKALKDWQVPGLALAIVKDDKIVVAKPSAKPVVKQPEKPANVCPSCGAHFQNAMKFCGECGKAMAS